MNEVGGLAESIERARALTQIPPGRAVGLDLYSRPKGFLETVASLGPGVPGSAIASGPAAAPRLTWGRPRCYRPSSS